MFYVVSVLKNSIHSQFSKNTRKFFEIKTFRIYLYISVKRQRSTIKRIVPAVNDFITKFLKNFNEIALVKNTKRRVKFIPYILKCYKSINLILQVESSCYNVLPPPPLLTQYALNKSSIFSMYINTPEANKTLCISAFVRLVVVKCKFLTHKV